MFMIETCGTIIRCHETLFLFLKMYKLGNAECSLKFTSSTGISKNEVFEKMK